MMDERGQSRRAAEITRKSRSNFALAFVPLSRERRKAIVTYYAFCRVVDDTVDEPGLRRDERLRSLERWRQAVDGRASGLTALERDVVRLQERYEIPPEELHLLIDGMEMDLDIKRYDTIDDLLLYCYRVACSVGFVCTRIFGCDPGRTKPYATHLGYFLQMTNIIRDVVEDWKRDERIYIPLEDLDRFGLDESAFQRRPEGSRFLEMMDFQFARAAGYYQEGTKLVPPSERRRLVASETMRDTYWALLNKMRGDGFRVFEKRYRLGRLHKLGILTRRILASML